MGQGNIANREILATWISEYRIISNKCLCLTKSLVKVTRVGVSKSWYTAGRLRVLIGDDETSIVI